MTTLSRKVWSGRTFPTWVNNLEPIHGPTFSEVVENSYGSDKNWFRYSQSSWHLSKYLRVSINMANKIFCLFFVLC